MAPEQGGRTFWSPEDDKKLKASVAAHSDGHERLPWLAIAQDIPGKSSMQCRQRWQAVDPNLFRGPWSALEDEVVISMQATVGNKWVMIARKLPGRSGTAVSNRWTRLRRLLKLVMPTLHDDEGTRTPGSVPDRVKLAIALLKASGALGTAGKLPRTLGAADGWTSSAIANVASEVGMDATTKPHAHLAVTSKHALAASAAAAAIHASTSAMSTHVEDDGWCSDTSIDDDDDTEDDDEPHYVGGSSFTPARYKRGRSRREGRGAAGEKKDPVTCVEAPC